MYILDGYRDFNRKKYIKSEKLAIVYGDVYESHALASTLLHFKGGRGQGWMRARASCAVIVDFYSAIADFYSVTADLYTVIADVYTVIAVKIHFLVYYWTVQQFFDSSDSFLLNSVSKVNFDQNLKIENAYIILYFASTLLIVLVFIFCRKKIRENQKLYNPRALRSVLCEWLTYLEKVNIAIELVYPKNKDKREYYVTDVGKVLSPSVKVDLTRFLDADDTTTVSELATMCFKMKIFSSEDDIKEEDLTSEPLLKCDSCKQKQNCVVFNMDFVQIDKEMQSDEAIKRNFAKTKFLCANFQLLDYQALKAAVIADCLNHQDLLKNLLRCLDGN